jgi:hypothetical protein
MRAQYVKPWRRDQRQQPVVGGVTPSIQTNIIPERMLGLPNDLGGGEA